MSKFTKKHIDNLFYKCVYLKCSVVCEKLTEEQISKWSSAKNKHTKSDSDESAKKKPKLNPVVLSQETPSTSTAQIGQIQNHFEDQQVMDGDKSVSHANHVPTANHHAQNLNNNNLEPGSNINLDSQQQTVYMQVEKQLNEIHGLFEGNGAMENNRELITLIVSPQTLDEYLYENEEGYKKLQKIILDHVKNADTFQYTNILNDLLKILQTNLYYQEFYIPNENINKNLCRWKFDIIKEIKDKLWKLIQMLRKDNNRVIIFMVYLVCMFRYTCDSKILSEIEMYANFFRFTDTIKNCIKSFSNNSGMEWLPKVWNSYFYEGSIIIEQIIFKKDKNQVHRYVNWPDIPKVEDLFYMIENDRTTKNGQLKPKDNNNDN